MQGSQKLFATPQSVLATAQLSLKQHSKPGRLHTKVERTKNNKHYQHTEYIGPKNHAAIYQIYTQQQIKLQEVLGRTNHPLSFDTQDGSPSNQCI
jgi:hypothetical protein